MACDGDWDNLHALAAWLATQRSKHDPDSVASRKMTQKEADGRKTNMATVVKLWKAVAARAPCSNCDADWAGIADDLARVASRAALQKERPRDQNGQIISIGYFEALCHELASYHALGSGSQSPRIMIIHDINMAFAGERKAAMALAA